ncbi:SAVED domain-containing protein [Euzebya tangerina]|uniref:SAVED domain-containing protein n=1 Tax=Euzebya tangerina TaxID=591198 RepID=UPI0013C362F1|nr:SAVED domain-containing protein [Euzebya tangerina]
MTLPSRAAAIRGDDYQHAIGWYWACQMLQDPDIGSVTIEDPEGGAFDDILIRRRTGLDTYIQAKSSNYGNTIVDAAWLLTPKSDKSRSPLQRFHDTYLRLTADQRLVSLELWTNRGFDHDNPLLGQLLDRKHDKVDTARMLGVSSRTKIGKERDAWAQHLGITKDELAAFLNQFSWKQTGSELDWHKHAKPLMQLAGLRDDDEALTIGVNVVRDWVSNGIGTRTVDDLRAEVANRNLLALTGTLLLAVDGIDHDPTPTPPNLRLDFVDLHEGDDSFSRKLLKDPADWDRVVRPAFTDAARTLASYRVRRVHIAGALRLPMWFAAGRSFPEVKKWIVSMDQVDEQWSTDTIPEDIAPRELARKDITGDTDVALAVALTGDPTTQVEDYLRSSGLPVGRMIVLGPHGKPSATAVPSPGWAMGWSRGARDIVRGEAQAADNAHIHLFMLCPAGIAMMLGHQWNVMPATTIYEFSEGKYSPTFTFPGA